LGVSLKWFQKPLAPAANTCHFPAKWRSLSGCRRKKIFNGRAFMIGLVIVTHGGLAQEFRNALEHVVGPQQALKAIAIGPDDDMEARRLDILDAVRDVNNGDGVIILTDMFGGTPSNLAISVMDETKAEVIAGISLPILVKLASIRSEVPLPEAVIMARDAGTKYIQVASQELSGG
jgi:PTS system mannose-specific IIA component